MAKLLDVVYGDSEQLENLFNGQTVSGHTYNENDLYIEELGDDIELGASGSGTSINSDNLLIVDSTALTAMGITATVTELNTLDGITATTTELNKLSGVTEYTASEIDTLWEATT